MSKMHASRVALEINSIKRELWISKLRVEVKIIPSVKYLTAPLCKITQLHFFIWTRVN